MRVRLALPFSFFIFVFSAIFGYAQNTVHGHLVDENGAALPSATVMLTSAKDSALIGFSMTGIAGGFVFENVPQGEIFLQATFLGYDQLRHAFSLDKKKTDKDLGDLRMLEKSTKLVGIEITDEL
ncbi:MAG TPA: carboxypeptidase regulatory-like domain-containing protein, partial [Bacteroidetes bacterium]|nr:carboxypeptidase regulatory-like domain-containing protein [Bacteroidota bacterium]